MYQPKQPIPIHPGEVLQEILDQNDLTQSALAVHLGMRQSKINEICRGKRGVTPDMAMRLGMAFNQSPQFWVNLQKNWELSQLDAVVYTDIKPITLSA